MYQTWHNVCNQGYIHRVQATEIINSINANPTADTISVIIAPADALAPDGAGESAGTVLTTMFESFYFKFLSLVVAIF